MAGLELKITACRQSPIKVFIRQLFCRHDWVTKMRRIHGRRTYDMQCIKCGKRWRFDGTL